MINRVVFLVALVTGATNFVHGERNHYIAPPILPVQQLIAIEGYNVDTHEIFTEDGAILEVHRIHGRKSKPNPFPSKGSVLLLPGITMSSYIFVIMPKKSLAYYLADRGYEVWVADLRGQAPMEMKTTTHLLGPKKWHFTQDDLALYDMPAMIDYIRNTSHVPKVHVVGYSLGNTAMVQLLAAKPEYNQRVASLTVMAPSIYVKRNTGPTRVFNYLPFGTFFVHVFVALSGFGALPLSRVGLSLGGLAAGVNNFAKHFGEVISQIQFGFDPHLNKDALPALWFRETPSPTLVLLQYFQASNSGLFSKFSYGKLLNKIIYGKDDPPIYDLKKIKTPILYMLAPSDGFESRKDVRYALDQFIIGGSLYRYYKINSPFFGHVSFLIGNNVCKKVNQPIYDFIERVRLGVPKPMPFVRVGPYSHF